MTYSTPKQCKLDGCNDPHQGHGYCAAHYAKFCKYGDPLHGRSYEGRQEPRLINDLVRKLKAQSVK